MKNRIGIRDITAVAVMAVLLEISKLALSWAANVELVSFFVIMFTLSFGRKTLAALPVFILVEGLIYGFSIWWIMYVYVWPLLAVVTYILKNNKSRFFWVIFSCIFGLAFGALCSVPYIFMGSAGGSVANGLKTAVMWWVAGIPFDVVHAVANAVIMFLLYKPVKKVLDVIKCNYLK